LRELHDNKSPRTKESDVALLDRRRTPCYALTRLSGSTNEALSGGLPFPDAAQRAKPRPNERAGEDRPLRRRRAFSRRNACRLGSIDGGDHIAADVYPNDGGGWITHRGQSWQHRRQD